MTINVYQIGDLAQATAAYTDVNGDDVDPTGLSIAITDPTGTVTTYVYGTDAELVKSSTGNYYVNISLTKGGDWRWKWTATGTGQCAGDGQLVVEPNYL